MVISLSALLLNFLIYYTSECSYQHHPPNNFTRDTTCSFPQNLMTLLSDVFSLSLCTPKLSFMCTIFKITFFANDSVLRITDQARIIDFLLCMSLLNVRLPTSISVMFLFLMSFLLAKQVQITVQVGTLGWKNQNWMMSSPIR